MARGPLDFPSFDSAPKVEAPVTLVGYISSDFRSAVTKKADTRPRSLLQRVVTMIDQIILV